MVYNGTKNFTYIIIWYVLMCGIGWCVYVVFVCGACMCCVHGACTWCMHVVCMVCAWCVYVVCGSLVHVGVCGTGI